MGQGPKRHLLNFVADQVHLFMAMVFPNGSGLFQQDNAPCHTAKIVQEWFEEHDKEFKVLTWPPNSPYLNLIEHLWDVLDKQVQSMKTPPSNLQDLKDLLLMSWCQIPQHTFRVVGKCDWLDRFSTVCSEGNRRAQGVS
ncbi:hypothetical protein PGIGA_G00098170 [Pangasianodon gigas]|uniref:Uncharacterized protein n=1 Tax=Pangasianodon gigas TaxID=30993 RepID=A0ACC5XE17_PANGG|nr:hypothetical protein [Pangasianodon gigas]